MSVAWSWAFDTPFKWTKQVASYFGGTRQGMAISWPGHITDKGGLRSQFHHIIDIVPTILEATDIEAPQMVNGIPQKPIDGVSMAYTFADDAADLPSTRTTQYFEMMGQRALYHDGWVAATNPTPPPWDMGLGTLPDVLDGYTWSLYDLSKDFSQNDDLAAQEPARLKQLQDRFLVEAAKYQVLPLDNSVDTRLLEPRPSATAGRDAFVYTGVLSGIPAGSAPDFLTRDFTITAEIEAPEGGGDGMLNTYGGRFNGYGLYLLEGKPVFTYNFFSMERFRWEGEDALAAGKHTIVFDFKYDGPGAGKGGTGTLSVDGAEVATRTIPHTIPFLVTFDESFDVGIDTRTPVDDADYKVPFAFTGTIDKLTVKVGKPQL